jgi:endonuclease YncB( thermonuclease family)
LSFNTPEKNTAEGKEAKEFVESLLEQIEGEEVTLFIPSKDGMLLTDINSFDRIVGEIWIGNEKLTDILLKHGYGEYKKYK